MIRTESINKIFLQADKSVHVLKNLSLQVAGGEFVALMGSSGAGKTTLMQLLGCLDRPTSGKYWLGGAEVSALDEEALATIRNRKIGFVFQTSHFVDYLDLLDNIALPGFYSRELSLGACRARSAELLAQMGLADRTTHLPAALSGGERQRAAIARALFNQPDLILADEPTGNLDSRNTGRVMEIFGRLYRTGITIVMVTHDRSVAEHAGRIIELEDGKIAD